MRIVIRKISIGIFWLIFRILFHRQATATGEMNILKAKRGALIWQIITDGLQWNMQTVGGMTEIRISRILMSTAQIMFHNA